MRERVEHQQSYDRRERFVNMTLAAAGIDVRLNGSNPSDMKINSPHGFYRSLLGGTKGIGNSYARGDWDTQSLDQWAERMMRGGRLSNGTKRALRLFDFRGTFDSLKARVINPQKGERAKKVGKEHYDRDPDLYKAMLDPYMAYSCAYWERGAENLAEAQEAKLELICQKLGLPRKEAGGKPMRVLDIGCGWGSFARYATERYNVEVVGITVSEEQAKLARELSEGLPVEIRYQPYQQLPKGEKYDRIVSVGMFEHVGYKNYREYMSAVRAHLNPDGLFLLHTIGRNDSETITNPSTAEIFPNSGLPSMAQIGKSIDGLFIPEDVHNLGPNYDPTLMAWSRNSAEYHKSKGGDPNDPTYREWQYYLQTAAGGFRARHLQLWQVVLSPNGVTGGYKTVR